METEAAGMKRKQNNAPLLSLLYDGPATSTELARLLKWTGRQVRVGVWVLKQQHYVRNSGRVMRSANNFPLQMYEITRRGVFIEQKRRERDKVA